MTHEQRIDAALDSVLKASGSALKYYTLAKTLSDMREAIRKVMSDAYIKGAGDCFELVAAERARCAAERNRLLLALQTIKASAGNPEFVFTTARDALAEFDSIMEQTR